MALYSFSAQCVGRNQALKNCIAAAAYRAGERLVDERNHGAVHDYTDKHVEQSEILAPEGAPEWVHDRSKLWNECEAARNRVLGITARELRIALPRELTRDQQVELMRGFLREEFVARGMVADWSLHDELGKDQPHVHVMLTTRALSDGRFGNQVREWDQKALLYHWREEWAEHANRALERAGHEERIDHRSYKDRGLELEPQPKLYRHPDHVAVDGRESAQERLAEFQETARRNGERILQDPSLPIRLLTERRATFRREDLLKVLNTHTVDAEQFSACLSAVMASPEIEQLPSGRFTSQQMLQAERRLLEAGDALAGDAGHQVAERHLRAAIARAERRLAREQPARAAAAAAPTLSQEQRKALEHLTRGPRSLALLEGHAGTGKSFLLGAAREAWEAEGLTVVGGALAGKAADGLARSSGIQSRTLASWERSWRLERDQLTDKHVLVIDEAGMLGTRQLGRVLETAREAGAKVVLVGDSRQLQAIEAGSPFRVLGERLGAEVLSEVRRQRVDWQREATQAFAGQRPADALRAYRDHGHEHAHMTVDETRSAVVSAWAEGLNTTPVSEQMIYAYRRDDVRALNELAREVRRGRGELGEDHRFTVELGARSFAVGDRLYFGRNDHQLGVMNGSLGTLERIEGQRLTVRLDGLGRPVTVDLGTYAHLDHGYASTVHKGQGATVDRAYVMASKLFDASVSYVAMSRQRDHVELHWAREEFGTRAELERVLCREQTKELALEQFDDRAITLKEVLKDESRFALLAPARQRELLAGYERALVGLREKQPLLSLQAELATLAKHPVLVEAQKHEASALVKSNAASNALAALQEKRAQGWLASLQSEQPLVAAEASARAEYDKAKETRETVELALREEVAERVRKNNAPILAREKRIQAWRSQLAEIEQRGRREHLLELAQAKFGPSARWATTKDEDAQLQVAGVSKLRPSLRQGRDTHALMLKNDKGEFLLHVVDQDDARELMKVGAIVKLQLTGHGLALRDGRGWGLGR